MRLNRALGTFLALVAFVAAAAPAAADARDVDQGIGLPFFPCLAGATVGSFAAAPGTSDNDGAYGRICFVNLRGSQWQAQTGEWILFRGNWISATEEQCEQFLANVTITHLFQGSTAPFDSLPCQMRPNSTDWATPFVFVARPMPPGTYSDTFTLTFNSPVFDGFFNYPAGLVLSFTATVMVVPGG